MTEGDGLAAQGVARLIGTLLIVWALLPLIRALTQLVLAWHQITLEVP